MDAAPHAILRKIAETNTCVELFTAVTLGDILLVRLLIESNADIHDAAVLNQAVEKGYIEIVRLLLDHGCPLAENALRIAIDHGHTDIVRLLLELPFDLGCTYFIDDDEVDILQYACDSGHTDIVRLLLGLPLDRGVDPAADNNFALRIACELGHRDIVRMFLDLPVERGVNLKHMTGKEIDKECNERSVSKQLLTKY